MKSRERVTIYELSIGQETTINVGESCQELTADMSGSGQYEVPRVQEGLADHC